MKEYTITFNGKEEKWIRSDEEMSFGRAQEWMKGYNGTPATVDNLGEVDYKTKKFRITLLKEAGVDGACWSISETEKLTEATCDFYMVTNTFCLALNTSLTFSCNYYALCRVC